MTKEEVASYIDHTLLAPDAGVKQIAQLCSEAIKYKFKSVCVNPVYISYAVFALAQTDIKVCTVIGFPFGASNPEVILVPPLTDAFLLLAATLQLLLRLPAKKLLSLVELL